MMEEIDYGAVFGIETGEKEQENAEPAQEQTPTQGENEQDSAEPDVEEEQKQQLEDEKEPEDAEEAPEETGPQEEEAQRERNAAFAAARRKAEAERDAAVKQAREEAQKAINEAFAASGLTNPYTGAPIRNKEEYDAYKQRYESERKNRILEKSGMSGEEFDAFIQDLPEVQQAKKAQQEAEQIRLEAQQERAKARIGEQLKEIQQLNPGIRELEDLTKMETYPALYELVKKGNTLVDAYKIANFDTLRQSAAEGAKQAARNSAAGKRHMSQTTQRGTGSEPVPAEVKEMYRMLNPEATEAEIQAHYNRRKNR